MTFLLSKDLSKGRRPLVRLNLHRRWFSHSYMGMKDTTSKSIQQRQRKGHCILTSGMLDTDWVGPVLIFCSWSVHLFSASEFLLTSVAVISLSLFLWNSLDQESKRKETGVGCWLNVLNSQEVPLFLYLVFLLGHMVKGEWENPFWGCLRLRSVECGVSCILIPYVPDTTIV